MPQCTRTGIRAAAHGEGMRTIVEHSAAHSDPSASAAPAPRDFAAELMGDGPGATRRAAVDLVIEATRAVRGLRSRMGLSDADVQDAIGETLL